MLPEPTSGIHWYDIAIALMSFIGAIAQFYGARLEVRPCRYIKISYGVTLTLVFLYTLFLKIFNDVHGIYPYAMVLILLSILCGAAIRIIELRQTRRICGGCKY